MSHSGKQEKEKSSVQQSETEAGPGNDAISITDHRSTSIIQRRQQELTEFSPQVVQGKVIQQVIDNSSYMASEKEKTAPIQKKENRTGMPDHIKSGMESLSGFAMDDVKVHYNSPKPSELNALAYAQGSDIHLGPGQEKHLPHEAWHVVQQKQGRVQPNTRLNKTEINNEPHLEKEADFMGSKSLTAGPQKEQDIKNRATVSGTAVVQGLFGVEVEANIPVYHSPAKWPGTGNTGASEIIAYLTGRGPGKGVYLHQGTAGSDKPYSITYDSGGPTKDAIQEIQKDWKVKATVNKQFLNNAKGDHPHRIEYVTEPYSERYLDAANSVEKPGLNMFFRDLNLLMNHVKNDQAKAKRGRQRSIERRRMVWNSATICMGSGGGLFWNSRCQGRSQDRFRQDREFR